MKNNNILLKNSKKKIIKKKKYYDPLIDPKFDPYQGYTYSNNSNDRKIGKGFLGENFRFETSCNNNLLLKGDKAVFWNGGWHLSFCFQRIDDFINKIISYSDNNYFRYRSLDKLKHKIISKIKSNSNIYGKRGKYNINKVILPESYIKGYNYNFEYIYWKRNQNFSNKEFIDYINIIKHEVPTQVWKNPICYSYILDRDYGINKKLCWQIIPKKDWKTIRFEKMNNKLIFEKDS